MKKILILANSDGGLYSFRLELIEKLLSEKFKVVLVAPKGAYTKSFMDLGCSYIDIQLSRRGTNIFQDLKLLKIYKKILKEEKPDAVFTYTIKPNIYGAIACRKYGIPCVANITGLGTAVENKGILQKITVGLYKYAFKKIQRVFFQNDENMQFFVNRKIALGKHKLLPGSGVNLNRFLLSDYPATKDVEFAFISRIMKEKGIDQYLDAARIIKQKHPNTVFHVCGDCDQEYKEKIENMMEQGIIKYHGRVKEVNKFLPNIHCLIHPTYYPEGMSNVLLESCASGRPIITTDRSGCREVVDDGKNGFVVRQQDSQDLIEKIEKFLALPYEERRQMGLNGRAKVEAQFDRNIVIDAYMEEIQ